MLPNISNSSVHRRLSSWLHHSQSWLQREQRLFPQAVGRAVKRATVLSLGALTISILFSALLGAGLARATSPYGMVDPVGTEQTQTVGYQVYIKQCATCHVALPAAVLPTRTWQTLVADPAHYGVFLAPISRFDQQLMLQYLQTYSRFSQGDRVPFRLQDSPYFQALHPNVNLPQPLNLRSCAGCHLGAAEQNYTGALDSADTSVSDTP